jgi:hypothetical protein
MLLAAPLVLALLLTTVDTAQTQQISSRNATEEWNSISASGTRRVFNLGIGSLFSFSSRQFTSQDSALDPNVQSAPQTPLMPQLVNGVIREFSYCWRYVAASGRKCSQQESTNNKCTTMGAFFEVLPHDWLSLRAREASYDLLQVSPQLPLPDGIPADAYFFAWGSSVNRVSAAGELLTNTTCPLHAHNVIAPFISQAYWDFIIGGILAWDGQLLDTRRYTWDLDAELSHTEEWMRRRVAVFPKYSYAKRRQIAVDVVRTTAKSGPAGTRWLDDRRCPFTGNSPMTLKTNLLYPQSTLDTIVAEAIGTVSPLSNDFFRSIVDDILTEGGWDVSARKALDCWSASVHIPRDSWHMNPYWDDIQRWRTEHLAGGAGTSKQGTNPNHHVTVSVEYPTHEEEAHRMLWLTTLILCVVNVVVCLVLVALSKHVGFRLTSLCREGVREELAAVKKQIQNMREKLPQMMQHNNDDDDVGSAAMPSTNILNPDEVQGLPGPLDEGLSPLPRLPPRVPPIVDTGV